MAFLRRLFGFVCAFILMIILAEIYSKGKKDGREIDFEICDRVKILEIQLNALLRKKSDE